jgi:hypothetical protein
MTDDGVDFSDNDFWRCADPLATDSIDVIAISPEKPLVVEIEGRVLAHGSSVRIELGEFGSFTKASGRQFLIGGYWRLIKPAPEDSLDYYTTKVLITVEQPVASSKHQPSNLELERTALGLRRGLSDWVKPTRLRQQFRRAAAQFRCYAALVAATCRARAL